MSDENPCPACGSQLEYQSVAGDRQPGQPQAEGIMQCNECDTVIRDGDVLTRMDQIHEAAWVEYANETGDWSIIP